jgi:hypothetical protein
MRETRGNSRYRPDPGYAIRLRPDMHRVLKELQDFNSVRMTLIIEMAFEKLGLLNSKSPSNVFDKLEAPEERRRFKEWLAKKKTEKENE